MSDLFTYFFFKYYWIFIKKERKKVCVCVFARAYVKLSPLIVSPTESDGRLIIISNRDKLKKKQQKNNTTRYVTTMRILWGV